MKPETIADDIATAWTAFASICPDWHFGYHDAEIVAVETALNDAVTAFQHYEVKAITVRAAWRKYTETIKRKMKQETDKPDLRGLRRSEMLLERAKYDLQLAAQGLDAQVKCGEVWFACDAIDQLIVKVQRKIKETS